MDSTAQWVAARDQARRQMALPALEDLRYGKAFYFILPLLALPVPFYVAAWLKTLVEVQGQGRFVVVDDKGNFRPKQALFVPVFGGVYCSAQVVMLSCMLRDLGGLAPTSLFVFSFVGPVALWGLVWVKFWALAHAVPSRSPVRPLIRPTSHPSARRGPSLWNVLAVASFFVAAGPLLPVFIRQVTLASGTHDLVGELNASVDALVADPSQAGRLVPLIESSLSGLALDGQRLFALLRWYALVLGILGVLSIAAVVVPSWLIARALGAQVRAIRSVLSPRPLSLPLEPSSSSFKKRSHRSDSSDWRAWLPSVRLGQPGRDAFDVVGVASAVGMDDRTRQRLRRQTRLLVRFRANIVWQAVLITLVLLAVLALELAVGCNWIGVPTRRTLPEALVLASFWEGSAVAFGPGPVIACISCILAWSPYPQTDDPPPSDSSSDDDMPKEELVEGLAVHLRTISPRLSTVTKHDSMSSVAGERRTDSVGSGHEEAGQAFTSRTGVSDADVIRGLRGVL